MEQKTVMGKETDSEEDKMTETLEEPERKKETEAEEDKMTETLEEPERD